MFLSFMMNSCAWSVLLNSFFVFVNLCENFLRKKVAGSISHNDNLRQKEQVGWKGDLFFLFLGCVQLFVCKAGEKFKNEDSWDLTKVIGFRRQEKVSGVLVLNIFVSFILHGIFKKKVKHRVGWCCFFSGWKSEGDKQEKYNKTQKFRHKQRIYYILGHLSLVAVGWFAF